METVYFGIILFLFLLAIFDLVVGVSNDAVNFLSSAVGAKVAPYRVIMWIAATGILCGALMSNGMMEIARHGIFRPEQFFFQELVCIFLAVMVTDVLVLDVFNTLGLPTSTTVSMVFELLGGTFALTLVKMAGTEGMHFADYLNTEKALSVIMGIFLSVRSPSSSVWSYNGSPVWSLRSATGSGSSGRSACSAASHRRRSFTSC